jgi:hypothetical protein
MKILSILTVLVFLNGCTTIKDCGVKPTITIDKGKEKPSTESNTDTKTTPGTIIQDIRENAVPGGTVKCTF